jgi:hypothetical protein
MVSASTQPFDAGDSFAPLDLPRPQTSTPAPTAIPAGLDFSSNPLPRPEALVIHEAQEPAKASRFGRKKKAPVDLLAINPGSTPSAAVSPVSALSASGAVGAVEKKAKRFGKKTAQTVDLLGAPIAARVGETPDTSQQPPVQDRSLVEPAEGKAKRKLFARVDRTTEKPLAPTNGRGRKIVQGLAAVSLLAGAGLFTMSFLDKKSPAPAPAVESTIPAAPVVDPAIDPAVSTIAPVQIDPATGLPLPAATDPQATQPNPNPATSNSVVDGTPVADTIPVVPAPAVDSVPGSTDTLATPTAVTPDAQAPVTTIAPGPDDLEFSTGGNFSEG